MSGSPASFVAKRFRRAFGSSGIDGLQGTGGKMKLHDHALIPSLDGLRAVSILIVFCAHARISTFLPGGFGVTIFFFLSGFLITTLFYREVERYGRIDMQAFYLRRFLRLSPPLLVTLLITYVLVALGVLKGKIDGLAITSQVFYFYNYYAAYFPDATQGARGLNVLWSLAVEEHFYLIFPWLFIALMRDRLQLTHLWMILGAILVWRFVKLVILGDAPFNIYSTTDTRFDSILYGSVLAIMNARGISARVFPSIPVQRNALLLASAAVLLFCLVWRDPVFRQTLRYTLQGIALMPIFYYAVTKPDLPVFRPLNWPPLQVLGFYSYTIYLAHTVVLANLSQIYPKFGTLGFALIAGSICLLYAIALNRFIEDPVRRLRRRLMPAGT